MLTHNQLIAVLRAEYPNIVHGSDFWVAHPVDGSKQTGEAFIVEWKAAGITKPTPEQIKALITKHAAAVTEASKPPVPAAVSRWQFLSQAVADKVMTSEEAIAVGASGAIPPKFTAAVGALPKDQQDQIKIMLVTVTSVSRDNGFINAIFAPALGWSAVRMDQFFIDAAKRT